MDLSKPRTPSGNDDDDNAIDTHVSEDDYDGGKTGSNSSGSAPALKDQSHRLHRSSANAVRCANIVWFALAFVLTPN